MENALETTVSIKRVTAEPTESKTGAWDVRVEIHVHSPYGEFTLERMYEGTDVDQIIVTAINDLIRWGTTFTEAAKKLRRV